jgi:hypothetical protein
MTLRVRVLAHVQRMLAVSVLEAIAGAPERVRSMVVSSTILAVICASVYVVSMIGYVRPFWSHHSMDLESCARDAAERLVRRTEDVRTCLKEHSNHPVVRALTRSYPALTIFAEARGPGTDTLKGDTSEGELVDIVFEGIMGTTDGGAILVNAHKLASGPSVSAVATPFSETLRSVDESACPMSVQRALCAIADARLIASTIATPIRNMQVDRTRKMDLPETVAFHVSPEFKAYLARMKHAFVVTRGSYVAAKRSASKVVRSLDTTADRIMWGETKEGFGFVDIFKLAGSLIKLIVPLTKMALKLIDVFAKSIGSIVQLIGLALKGVEFVASELTRKGLMAGVLALVRVVIGFAIKVVVALFKVVVIDILAFVLVFWYPIVSTVFLTVVFIVILASKLVIAVADFASEGTLRCLGRTDQDPNAWWKCPGFERGNVFTRNVVAWRPCLNGFVVSDSGVFCERIPMGVPSRSPAALIARCYLTGSFGELGRKVPSRDAASLERYSRLCSREYKRFLNGNPHIKDFVATIVMCRHAVLKSSPVVEELAHYAVGADPADPAAASNKMSFGVVVVVAAAVIASLGFAGRTLSSSARV